MVRSGHNYIILALLSKIVIVTASSIAVEDLPPLLDADDIEYFFENITQLHWVLDHVFRRSERNLQSHQVFHKLPEQLIARGGGSTYTTAYKLDHDIEQMEYLKPKHPKFDTILPIYQRIRKDIPPLEELQQTAGLYAFQGKDEDIRPFYNKALHHTNFDVLKDADGNVISLLNPDLNWKLLEQQWEESGVVVVDQLLRPQALQRIRQVMLESTVWYQTKMPQRFGGYVGAYIDDGLHDMLLLQLAYELYQASALFKGHFLRYLWAYKYDSNYNGIHLHADQAAVNVNIWLTPDEANLDPTSGGLVVFTAKPPLDWNFRDYNNNPQRIRDELLEPNNFSNITIPHRQNRAVIFDSALFHQTDRFHFRKGYGNRRINLTLLYGKMQKDVKDEL